VLKVRGVFRYTRKRTCGAIVDVFRSAKTDRFCSLLGRRAAGSVSHLLDSHGETWSNNMDVLKMLADLRQEREQLEEAILTLERLARGRGRRRGRPPAWMTELKRRGRPPGSKNKAKESTAA
jgi:hypothetical protein